MSTPHNGASVHQIAKTVILPGDPLRAQYIAEKFLPDSVQITSVRNMLGFTGSWKGIPVTVMGSGMGGPSAGIYAYELFHEYSVEKIIRTGTAGGLQSEIGLGHLVFAMTASTDSAWAHQYSLSGTYSPCTDFSLLEKAVAIARKESIPFHAGSVFSSDFFSEYNALGSEESWKKWAKMGCLAQDMETYALYSTAAWLGKRAFSVLINAGSCVTGENLSQDKMIVSLNAMCAVALGLLE